ncbi:MAG: outer membrane beta-barrel protein [Gammaproteobacteria bacterium]|nr:outer membrane beta-barrel protein [Gammaproteobacteria bacterium]
MRYLTVLILSLIPLTTLASSKINYLYVGGDAGIFLASMNQNYQDQVDIIANNIAQPINQNGYTAGIRAGYVYTFQSIYSLGAELSGNYDTQNASFKSGAASSAFSDTTKIQYHIDMTIVPGINLSDSILGYMKLGMSFASISDQLTSPAGFFATYTTYNSHWNGLGFAAGLGVSKVLTSRLSIFTEANYHDYGSIDFDDFQNFSADYTHTAHIYSYDVVMGVTYKIV